MNIQQAIDNLPDGVVVSETSIVLYQDSDSNDSNVFGQTITIETQDAGGGPFIVISTERWATDDEDGLRRVADLAEALRKIPSNMDNLLTKQDDVKQQ